jgi:hypothetical protein
MEMMTKFLTCEEFEKDFKHLAKKYPSLEKDFQDIKDALCITPFLPHTERIDQLGQEILLPVYKVKKMRCRSLQSSSKLRLIYAYDVTKQEIQFIQFLELYAKGEKEVEDRERIEKYLKGKRSLGEEK